MELISVSQKTARGLSELNSMPKPALGAICRYFLQMVVAGSSSIAIEKEWEEALTATSTIILEAAKAQATSEQIRSSLLEHGVNSDVTDALSELYSQHRDNLIQHMLSTGIALPAIVDIDWRLDYNLRSKLGGRETKPLYFVSLTVKDRGLTRHVDMVADQEELQDLFNKVRDAVKQIERVLSTGESS